jgi:predicted double-glycine peptidase
VRRANLLCLALLVACASAPVLPPKALKVPLVRQATTYSCGAAALLSVLFYWRVYDGNESSLYAELGTTPENGTPPESIARVATRFGLTSQVKTGMTLSDLRGALARGATVILDIQAWRDPGGGPPAWRDRWEDGHYVVLIGMDERRAYVMDPSTAGGYGWIPLAELEDRWHDYEDRGGRRVEWVRAGIVLQGTTPTLEPPLTRVE